MIHAAKPGTTKKLSGRFKPAVKVMNLNDLASNLIARVSDIPIISNFEVYEQFVLDHSETRVTLIVYLKKIYTYIEKYEARLQKQTIVQNLDFS